MCITIVNFVHNYLWEVLEVAAAVPAFGTVHLVKQLETQMLVRPARRTVNHNQIYSSHYTTIEFLIFTTT